MASASWSFKHESHWAYLSDLHRPRPSTSEELNLTGARLLEEQAPRNNLDRGSVWELAHCSDTL